MRGFGLDPGLVVVFDMADVDGATRLEPSKDGEGVEALAMGAEETGVYPPLDNDDVEVIVFPIGLVMVHAAPFASGT
jgi:hypothetical protein